MKAIQFYPMDHPRVTDNFDDLSNQLNAFLSEHRHFIIGLDNNRLLIQETPVEDDELSDQLVQTLEQRQIGSVIINHGVTEQEIQAFLEILTTFPGNLLEDGEIRDEYLDSLQHIQIDELEVQFSTTAERDSFVDGTKNDVAETDSEPEDENTEDESDTGSEAEESPFSSLESRTEALKNLLSSDPGPELIYDWMNELASELNLTAESDPVETGFETVFQLIDQVVRKAEAEGEELPDEPIRQFIVQFMIRVGLIGETSFSSVKNQLGTFMDQLDVGVKQLLVDDVDSKTGSVDALLDTVDPKARGLAVAREIRNGTASMNKISQMMESITPDGDDVTEVISSAVEEMSHFTTLTKEQSAADELAFLFNALLADTPYQNPSPQILIADDDEKYDQYLLYLSNLQYFFDLHENGFDAWRAINSGNDFDLVILEIRIPGKTGLELLEDLTTLKNPPPVIVCTKYPQFRDAYEIQTYPRLEFIEKPVQEDQFNRVVQKLLPSSSGNENKPGLYSDEEMERARRIQRKLMQQPLPEIPEFETGRFHQSPELIGGDYLDVVPISDEEYLIALANVSGAGVSASIVMIILRSTLSLLQNKLSNPRKILFQLNRFITNEINRPLYATILLGRLNTSERTMQMTSAGNTSPIFWNQKSQNMSPIDLTGIPVGLTGDRRFNEFLSTRNVALNEGDAIVFYSNGIPNTTDGDGESFGMGRLKKVIQQNASRSAKEITTEMENELTSFRGDTKLTDDCSMLTIKST